MASSRLAYRLALGLGYLGLATVVAGAFLVRAQGKSALWLMGCGIALVVAGTFVAPRRGGGSVD